MADPRGFLNIEQQKLTPRPVHQRIKDFRELYHPMPAESIRRRRRGAWTVGYHSATRAVPSGT